MSLRAPFSTAVAIAIGLIVLAGYFLNIPLLTTTRDLLLRWALILFTVALLVGVANLASVHWQKMNRSQGRGGFYSFILLLALIATLLVGLFFGSTSAPALWIFNYLQIPVETSLMAVLAVTLIYALARMFGRRMNLLSALFLGAVLVVLLSTATLPGFDIPALRDLRSWLGGVWALGGARGLLLGVALGTVAVGLRILTGVERPYGG